MDTSEEVKMIYFFLNGTLESSKQIKLSLHKRFYQLNNYSDIVLYPGTSYAKVTH